MGKSVMHGALGLAGLLGLLLLWWVGVQVFGEADGLSARFSPQATLASLVQLLGEGEVYGHAWVSLKRILVGLLMALLVGVPLGLLVGSYRHLEAATTPAFQFLRMISPLSWMPVVVMLMGVGDHNSLFTYDLLKTGDTPLQAVAEGVFELHALYGVDRNSDDIVDEWVSPSDSGAGYTVADLSSGNAAAAERLTSTKALRVGLILRTALPERDEISGDELNLFADLGDTLQYTRKLSEQERRYRYRTLESTIPVRNNLP